MTTLRAHFDGRVIVPDEPVDLPQGPLEIDVRSVGELKPLSIVIDKETGIPHFDVPVGMKRITLEDIKRAMDDE